MIEFLGACYKGAAIAAFVLVPLGLWKAVEVLAWIFQHVRVSWT